ncbi:MAG: YMGG-like glycine zipper-containing protein [Dongiaceae bacterium]
MNRTILAIGSAVLLVTAGCSGMNKTEQRVLSGGAIGAGTGAAVGAVTDMSVGTGALIGAGVGAAAGYIYDQDRRD